MRENFYNFFPYVQYVGTHTDIVLPVPTQSKTDHCIKPYSWTRDNPDNDLFPH